ncbi:hypothetical protein N7490_009860 [Penicillium lividum]|nr:hypothetical protein N7490_009860 [Penicillium lividum]
MSIALPVSRRVGASKSRSGCRTCKIRRVKCGEEKPTCLRCSSTGRGCEYEDRLSPQGFPTLPLVSTQSLSASPNSGSRERRAFEYYFQHTAQHLAGGMQVDFWTKVIPQISRSEPAIWDGIIAISALFEHPNQRLDFPLVRNHRKGSHALNQVQQEALSWYSRSISTVHSRINRGCADPYLALISCVLFICVETIQGRLEEALQLFHQGVTLISDLRTQISHGNVSLSKASLLEHTIIPLFLRMGSLSLTISGTQPSEIFSFAESHTGGFFSIEHARSTMIILAAEVILFEREAGMYRRATDADSVVDIAIVAREQALRARLAKWYASYTELRRSYCPIIEPDPLLLSYHAAASITLTGCLTSLEMVFDAHLADFSVIVEQATLILDASRRPDGSQPPFTFEPGVGVPLFLTALKCRQPGLRRRALQLLREAPPMQGFFICPPVAIMAGRLMMLEESYSTSTVAGSIDNSSLDNPFSLTMLQTGSQIPVPEEARINYYCIFRPQEWYPPGFNLEESSKIGCGPDQLFLHFSRNRFDSDSNVWRRIFECVPLGDSP